MEVNVEVVDVPLDYNLLLERNWTYSMTIIMSSILCDLCFPHNGKIVTIDQFSFVHTSPSALVGPSVPMIDNSQQENENVGIEMYSSLMGIFDFMEPIHHIHAISREYLLSMRSIPLCTSYFNDPWTLPSPTMSYEGQSHIRMAMPLSTTKVVYHDILNPTAESDRSSSWTNEVDPILDPVWATQSYCSHDFLDDNLPSNEAILEAMPGIDRP
jgi:hypothetical protein